MTESLKPRGLRAPDIRRTAETFLSEQRVSGEDRGFLMSHGLDRNAMHEVYDKAQRLPRKAELLLMWQAYLDGTSPDQ